MTNMKSSERRSYRMVARADAAIATADRILDAAVAAFWERPSDQISLEEVARRAGVTVQTVIRRFGGRDGLLAAAGEREARKIEAQRNQAPVGDVSGAVRVLVEHYEAFGDRVVRMLAEEAHNPRLREVVDRGRQVHHDWCERVFQPVLLQLGRAERERRLAQLVAVCDVHTWALLRRGSRLSRGQTELALIELLEPMVEGA